jgi:signal peptide peptidase SppA, 36K type
MKKFYFIAVLFSMILIASCAAPRVNLFNAVPDPLKEFTLEGTGSDKVLLISVTGLISDSPKKDFIGTSPSVVEEVVAQINKAKKDKQIKAVLFKINSAGGTITASDLLYHEISVYKEKAGVKIVVSMMDVAASGAYYISLPADVIMAHPTTITGSVGVISLQPKVSGLMNKLGLGIDVKKFGRHKDMGSPFRESSEEEQKLMQKAVNDFGERFIGLVKKHRHLSPQALTEVSTARVFLADEALGLGLVDKIGYISDALKETKKIAGIPENARVVVYRRMEFPEDNYYNIAGAELGKLNIPLINLELPEAFSLKAGFYYLWPGAISMD